MRFAVISVLILIVLIAGAGYFYYGMMPAIEKPPVASTTPIASATIPLPASSKAPEVPVGWRLYTSKNGYTLNYPPDLTIETTPEGERFYKLGPTQSTGTELYDGISFLIRTGDLAGLTLRQLADQKHQQNQDAPTTQEITDVKPITYGPHQGYQFRVNSLGEGDYIYLVGPNAQYLEIINLTVEPANREQTFQGIVETMFSSIRF